MRWSTLLAIFVVAGLLGAGIGTLAGLNWHGHLPSLTAASSNGGPVVVDITTSVTTGNGSGQAAGTGLVLTSSGLVLTNNHVIEGSTKITVMLPQAADSFSASVVGVDPKADIAVLQVEGVKGWQVTSFADSSHASVGQAVSAEGNALGVGGAPRVSTGKITALAQTITAGGTLAGPEQLDGLIQFDATVVPGESGGPLLDAQGQVLGMITASSGNGDLPSQPAYAIPSNAALAVVRQIEGGHASADIILGQVGYMGIVAQNLDAASASQLGLAVQSGVLVVSVGAGSPASAAGIRPGDVIVGAAGTTISTQTELRSILDKYKPGDQVQVDWMDAQATTHSAELTLTTGPAV